LAKSSVLRIFEKSATPLARKVRIQAVARKISAQRLRRLQQKSAISSCRQKKWRSVDTTAVLSNFAANFPATQISSRYAEAVRAKKFLKFRAKFQASKMRALEGKTQFSAVENSELSEIIDGSSENAALNAAENAGDAKSEAKAAKTTWRARRARKKELRAANSALDTNRAEPPELSTNRAETADTTDVSTERAETAETAEVGTERADRTPKKRKASQFGRKKRANAELAAAESAVVIAELGAKVAAEIAPKADLKLNSSLNRAPNIELPSKNNAKSAELDSKSDSKLNDKPQISAVDNKREKYNAEILTTPNSEVIPAITIGNAMTSVASGALKFLAVMLTPKKKLMEEMNQAELDDYTKKTIHQPTLRKIERAKRTEEQEKEQAEAAKRAEKYKSEAKTPKIPLPSEPIIKAAETAKINAVDKTKSAFIPKPPEPEIVPVVDKKDADFRPKPPEPAVENTSLAKIIADFRPLPPEPARKPAEIKKLDADFRPKPPEPAEKFTPKSSEPSERELTPLTPQNSAEYLPKPPEPEQITPNFKPLPPNTLPINSQFRSLVPDPITGNSPSLGQLKSELALGGMHSVLDEFDRELERIRTISQSFKSAVPPPNSTQNSAFSPEFDPVIPPPALYPTQKTPRENFNQEFGITAPDSKTTTADNFSIMGTFDDLITQLDADVRKAKNSIDDNARNAAVEINSQFKNGGNIKEFPKY
jgi:hypothetical protein